MKMQLWNAHFSMGLHLDLTTLKRYSHKAALCN